MDPFVPNYPKLDEFALVKTSDEERESLVNSFFTLSISWDLLLFPSKLPKKICDTILVMAPPSAALGPNRIAWDLTPNQSFSICSAYVGLHIENNTS